MTAAALAPAYVELALLAAAEAAAAALPPFSDTGWSVQPTTTLGSAGGDPVSELGKGPRAVSLGFGGVGRLILCVSATVGRNAQVGPPPTEDLLDGLTPALRAAANALVAAFGAESSAPAEVPIGSALQARAGEQLLTVALHDGGAPAAILALACPVPAPEAAPAHEVAEFAALGGGAGAPADAAMSRQAKSHQQTPIDLLADVEMGVTAELGRARMLVREILELSPGSVIELDRAAGSPIDVLVNGTLIARGEVVVIDEEFGIRITEVLGYDAGRS